MGNICGPKQKEIEQCFNEDVRRRDGYFRHLTTRYMKNLNILDCRILYVVQGEISLFFAPRAASCYDKREEANASATVFAKLANYNDTSLSNLVRTLSAGDYCILFGDDLHYSPSDYHAKYQLTAVCTSRETCSYVSITYPRLAEFLQVSRLTPLRSLLTTRMSALLSLSDEFQYLTEEQLDVLGASMRVVQLKSRSKIMEFNRAATAEHGGYFAILLLGSWLKKLPPSKCNDLFSPYSLHDTEPLETIPDNSIRSTRRNSTQRRLTENLERSVSQKIKTFRSSTVDSRDADSISSNSVTLASGAVIGLDLCLVPGARALYSVSSMCECVVGMISKASLTALSTEDSPVVQILTNNMKSDMFESVLDATPLFWGISLREIAALAATATIHTYNTGDSVFQQGDVGDRFYMVIHGAVEVYVSSTAPNGTLERPRLLKTLSAPNYFGEIALISSEKRGATVISNTYTVLLSLTKASFHSVFNRTHEPLSELNIRLYGENVDLLYILRHGKAVAAFKSYLQSIHAVEMLLFWLDVDKFEQMVIKQHDYYFAPAVAAATPRQPKANPYRQRSTYIREQEVLPIREAVNTLMGLVFNIMETYIAKDTKYQINISRMMMESIEAEHTHLSNCANDVLNIPTETHALKPFKELLMSLQKLFSLPKKEMFYLLRDGCYLRWKQSEDFRQFILSMQPYKM